MYIGVMLRGGSVRLHTWWLCGDLASMGSAGTVPITGSAGVSGYCSCYFMSLDWDGRSLTGCGEVYARRYWCPVAACRSLHFLLRLDSSVYVVASYYQVWGTDIAKSSLGTDIYWVTILFFCIYANFHPCSLHGIMVFSGEASALMHSLT